MAKRAQQGSGEERVTAKSRPMMNLTARMPSVVSSSTSVSPGKKYYGNQDPWKSVQSEIISLDAGLRMGGLYLLLIFWTWWLKYYVQPTTMSNPKHSSIQETDATPHSKAKTQNVKRRQKFDQLSDVAYVPTNTHSSQNESQLYIFEDNEAVIGMIIKGRSPTMWHVSRTPQSCSWLFVRQSKFGTQDPNQIHWHQKPTRRHTDQTNSLTFCPNEVSQEMNGVTLFVSSILWISRCILVAIWATFLPTIPIRLESRAPCRSRRLRTKALQRWKRSHVWCCASKGVSE